MRQPQNTQSDSSNHTALMSRVTLEDLFWKNWQKSDIIGPLFGWKQADGRRKYRMCYVEIPRKNGKSSLTAAIALYLVGLDEQGPEIISAAGDAAQIGPSLKPLREWSGSPGV